MRLRARHILFSLMAAPSVYAGIAITMPFYSYRQDQAENVVITRGGQPIKTDKTPGFGYKSPLIESANRFTTKLVDYRSIPQDALTSDKKTIQIDFYAMYRIADPELFIAKVRPATIERAQSIIDDFVYSEMRNVISQHYDLKTLLDKADDVQGIVKKRVSPLLKENAAIELVDVRLTTTNPTQNVLGSVYDRMRAERNQRAQLERSEGQRTKIGIMAEADREVAKLTGEAYAKAQRIKGDADAEALRIIQGAYAKDQGLAFFLRELKLLEETTGDHDELIISTKSDLYNLVKKRE